MAPTLLNIPYISQRDGPGAGDFANDCGPASVAMLVRPFGKSPSVADVYRATGVTGDRYISSGQLAKASSKYGVTLSGKHFGSLSELRATINARKAIMALVHYGTFSALGKTESPFKGPHFLNVVGFEGSDIIVHDPLWRGQGGKYLRWQEQTFWRAWEEARLDKNPSFFGMVTAQTYALASGVPTQPSQPLPQDADAYGVGIVGGRLNVSALRVRHDPSPTADTIAYLRAGATVDVMEEPLASGWAHVRYRDETGRTIEGWCGTGGLDVIPRPVSPDPPPPPPPTVKKWADLTPAEKDPIIKKALVQLGLVGADDTVLE